MEPRTFLVTSEKCLKGVSSLGELHLKLNLPISLRFTGRTWVRLHSVAGLHEEVSVFASFADLVPCGDQFRRHLAISAPGSLPGPWSIVDGNFIENLATLTITKINGEPFTTVPDKNFVLLFELQNGDV